VRVQLKGINTVRKRLADGRVVTYYYAWKGGPRLRGKPGTPEFHASYNQAVAERQVVDTTRLNHLIDYYLDSASFDQLSDASKATYRSYIVRIRAEFGDLPIKALADRAVRAVFLEWRDKVAETSTRSADFGFAVLARIISFAHDRGKAPANPCQNPGRLYRPDRASIIWTHEDEEAFHAVAPHALRLALLLAVWTGQRQGDLLRLTWASYNGARITLRQQKTKARVTVPVASVLKEALDVELAARRAAYGGEVPADATILTGQRGQPWTSSGFRASWGRYCKLARIEGKTFHDLRGTMVSRLALADSSVPEIAAITGHSLADVYSIVDAHYLHRDQKLAESAMRKLELRSALPTELPTDRSRGRRAGEKSSK
jgi:integrase